MVLADRGSCCCLAFCRWIREEGLGGGEDRRASASRPISIIMLSSRSIYGDSWDDELRTYRARRTEETGAFRT